MSKSSVVARVIEGDRLECRVVPLKGEPLVLTGSTKDMEPTLEGSAAMQANLALVHNAWAFAKFTYLKVNLPTAEEQKAAEKTAKGHRETAEWLADLVDDLGRTTSGGWCSGCFTDCDHHKVNDPAGPLPAYLCTNCGSPTLPCASPGCDSMALRGEGSFALPRYCAEHRHDIPGFAKAGLKIDHLEDYRDFLQYEKPNLSTATKLGGLAVAVAATGGVAAFAAAPAIGGAIGSAVGGYSGAAASSYGLAMLGGGSLASGGLGMAGGTMVVSALGGLLGGAVSASVTNAYLREDDSFRIEMLRGGEGVPVVVCNGFLTEKDKGWGEWREIVTTRYPDSPVYRVHWGAKELKHLGSLVGMGAVNTAGPLALKKAAMTATKAGAKKLSPLAPMLVAASLAKNPWHVAKNRADKTGAIVADLLARTTTPSYVLVGHSLGARAMVVAAQALGTKTDGPRLEAVHLLGAAIGAASDWSTLTARVDGAVHNYHSANDGILKVAYTAAQLGRTAAGLKGFTPVIAKLHNVDVSEQVDGHSDYFANVTLR